MEVTFTLNPLEMMFWLIVIFCIAYTVLSLAQAIVIGAKTSADLDEPEAPAESVPPTWATTTDYHLLAPPLPPAVSLDFKPFGIGWQGESTGTFRTLDVDPPVLVGEVEEPTRHRFERKPAEPAVEHVLTIHLDERYDDIKVPLAVSR